MTRCRGLYEPSVSPLYRLFAMFGPIKDIDIQVRPPKVRSDDEQPQAVPAYRQPVTG